MGIFPAWINVIPVTYPIIIHPDSPINTLSYPDLPPTVTSISFPVDETIIIHTQPVTGVIYG